MSKWVICAAGPSMARVDMSAVKRSKRSVMVVNCSFRLAPWASVLYAGDAQWWDRYGEEALLFQGERWTRDGAAALRHRLKLATTRVGKGLCREQGCVHTGGNSGYQAVNLAWHMGARDIVLLGFDMHRRDGGHWHGEHEGMLSAPASHIAVWRREFDSMAFDLRADGVRVVNATIGTELTCFPCLPLADALQ